MFVDHNGRSLLGVWNEKEQQWEMDVQGLHILVTLAEAARKRLEKDPEAHGATFVPHAALSKEEIADTRKELEEQNAFERAYNLAQFEVEIRSKEQEERESQGLPPIEYEDCPLSNEEIAERAAEIALCINAMGLKTAAPTP